MQHRSARGGTARRHFKRLGMALLVILGLLATVRMTCYLGGKTIYQRLHQQTLQELNGLVAYLEGELGRYRTLPQLLAENPLLAAHLAAPEDAGKSTRVNQLLARVAGVTQASDVYLVDAEGTVIAASNWQQPGSFVGSNFAFRPYFIQAMAGNSGQYFAVGVQSQQRGYYFSAPVLEQGRITGVIVVKVHVAQMEARQRQIFGGRDNHFLITSNDGVIFMSDQSQWLMRSIQPMSAQQRQLLQQTQRYGGQLLDALPLEHREPPSHLAGSDFAVRELAREDKPPQRYLTLSRAMSRADWQVHVWLPHDLVEEQQGFLVLVSSSGFLLVLMILLFALERMRNLKNLRHSRSKLEHSVVQRTRQLTQTNQRLMAEIEQRESAQQELKTAQEQLIQSAKLALLGEMSASINHELNQPLTALRSYSQNARTFLERQMPEQAADNLRVILELLDRMAAIVGQFKAFTRKSDGVKTMIEVGACIDSSLTIVQPQLARENIELQVNRGHGRLYVLGDGIRLEQVLVNLITNAIQALADCDDKHIWLTLEADNDFIHLGLRDSGTGIGNSEISQLFEPFYTTKEGHGLGLGLSISRRIVESMAGHLNVSNHPSGGAEFTLSLPRYLPGRHTEEQGSHG